MIASFAYFLVVMLGLGLGAWKLLQVKEEDKLAAFFLMLATGTAVFVFATVVLGFLNLATWWAYLAVVIVLLVAAITTGKMKAAIPQVSSIIPKLGTAWIIVLVIFIAHFAIYYSGAFGYPWLEDDDPWEHAAAARYVSIFNTFIQPVPHTLHYLAPYPPFFDVILGTLFQVDGAGLQAILKFFNVLMVSLTIPLFYCWAKQRFDGRIALWATFILAVLPSFMSHFIWAQSLAMLFVFPALYFIDKYSDPAKKAGSNYPEPNDIKLRSDNQENLFGSEYAQGEDKEGNKEDTKAKWIGGISYNENAVLATGFSAAVIMTQPSTAAMFLGLVAAYIAAHAIHGWLTRSEDSFRMAKKQAIVTAAGLALGLAVFWIPMVLLFSVDGVTSQIGLNAGLMTDKTQDTSGGVVYDAWDFVHAESTSKMDQPIGWGEGATLLLAIGVIVSLMGYFAQLTNLTNDKEDTAKKDNDNWLATKAPVTKINTTSEGILLLFPVLWFIYGIIGTEGNMLPLKLFPHRFWVILAIPVAILAAIGAKALLEQVEKRWAYAKGLIIILLVAGIAYTSAIPKADVETSKWPPGVHWISAEQISGYSSLAQLPPNTKVFSYCMPETHVNGFGLFGYAWDKNVVDYKLRAINDSVSQNYAFLRQYGYEYAVIDHGCIRTFTADEINGKINALMSDNRFEKQEKLSGKAVMVFKVK